MKDVAQKIYSPAARGTSKHREKRSAAADSSHAPAKANNIVRYRYKKINYIC